MRSTTLPPLRVAPEVRAEAERLLDDDETLSGLMHEAVRRELHRRRAEREFLARGLASAERARETGEYYSADVVLGELEDLLAEADRQTASQDPEPT